MPYLDVVEHQRNSMNKLSELLSDSRTQRVLYGLGLTLWIVIWWRTIERGLWNSESSLGISYLTLISIPACLLIIQIILYDYRITYILVSICMLQKRSQAYQRLS